MKQRENNNQRGNIKEIPISLCPNRIAKVLLTVLLILTVCNLGLIYTRTLLDSGNWFATDTLSAKIELNIVRYFDFNSESNIPSFFSSLLLLASAFIVFLIYKKVNDHQIPGKRKPWLFLSIVFLYMAIDENVQIHEMAIGPVRSMLPEPYATYLHYSWVIPYAVIAGLAAMYLTPLLLKLNSRTRNLMILSGVVFISGAMGLEVIGGYIAAIHGTETLVYKLLYTGEEFLEMFGVILFIYSMVDYIKSQKVEFVLMPVVVRNNN